MESWIFGIITALMQSLWTIRQCEIVWPTGVVTAMLGRSTAAQFADWVCAAKVCNIASHCRERAGCELLISATADGD